MISWLVGWWLCVFLQCWPVSPHQDPYKGHLLTDWGMSLLILEQPAFFYAKKWARMKIKNIPRGAMTQCPVKEPAKFFLLPEDVYLNIFEDTTDPLERRILAQRIIDVIALRPRLDLQDGQRRGWRCLASQRGQQNPRWLSSSWQNKISYFHEPNTVFTRIRFNLHKLWHPESGDMAVLPETGLRFQDWTVYLMHIERKTKADQRQIKDAQSPQIAELNGSPFARSVW